MLERALLMSLGQDADATQAAPAVAETVPAPAPAATTATPTETGAPAAAAGAAAAATTASTAPAADEVGIDELEVFGDAPLIGSLLLEHIPSLSSTISELLGSLASRLPALRESIIDKLVQLGARETGRVAAVSALGSVLNVPECRIIAASKGAVAIAVGLLTGSQSPTERAAGVRVLDLLLQAPLTADGTLVTTAAAAAVDALPESIPCLLSTAQLSEVLAACEKVLDDSEAASTLLESVMVLAARVCRQQEFAAEFVRHNGVRWVIAALKKPDAAQRAVGPRVLLRALVEDALALQVRLSCALPLSLKLNSHCFLCRWPWRARSRPPCHRTRSAAVRPCAWMLAPY